MAAIEEMIKIDFSSVFLSVFVILIGIKAIVSIFEWVIDKLGLETKWMRKRREEHDLLMQTAKDFLTLQEKQKELALTSDARDNQIREDLSAFISEIKHVISDTQSEIKIFAENRVRDREQSISIQKEFSDAIKSINERGFERDKQIDALTLGNKEVLGNIINERYQKYIRLNGIPSDEVDEFTNIHDAYKSLGGNHNGDLKYNYVTKHLQVIPVETKMVTKDNE